jgi:hypothetical protein
MLEKMERKDGERKKGRRNQNDFNVFLRFIRDMLYPKNIVKIRNHGTRRGTVWDKLSRKQKMAKKST